LIIFNHSGSNGAIEAPDIQAIYGNNPNLMFKISDGVNEATTATPDSPMVAGRWYYGAFTWSASTKTVSLYLNGVFKAKATNTNISLSTLDVVSPLYVGRHEYWSSPFEGDLGALRISNYVKTPKEIYDYYNGSNVKEVG
jgi:hypothetical protein